MTLSGATTPCQCGPGSDVNERVLRIPPSSSNTWASPNPGHSLGESYCSAEMQSVYYATPAEWASKFHFIIIIMLCR